MTNALTVYDQFDELQRAAIALKESGYFKDVTSKAQAIVKVMAGAELGLPPFASMTGIHIIQGKPVLGANVLATLVKNDPRYDYHIITKPADQDTEMFLEWSEGILKVGVAGYTMKEAQTAGLTNKDNWKKYPSDMLFARAISRGARRFAPGIFGGSPVYTPDEMGADVDEEGNVIVDNKQWNVKYDMNLGTGKIDIVETDLLPDDKPKSNGDEDYDRQKEPHVIYQAVVDAGLSENVHAAKNVLQTHCKTGYDTEEKAIAWMRLYRGWKDTDLNTIEAAEKANEGQTPK